MILVTASLSSHIQSEERRKTKDDKEKEMKGMSTEQLSWESHHVDYLATKLRSYIVSIQKNIELINNNIHIL